jgi:hypothetical protein
VESGVKNLVGLHPRRTFHDRGQNFVDFCVRSAVYAWFRRTGRLAQHLNYTRLINLTCQVESASILHLLI